MDLVALFNEIPLHELLGIELLSAENGAATGKMTYREELLSNPGGEVVHGGVTYALADTVGGAAVMSLTQGVSPTVDMRIDYLAPATGDLRAEADVLRRGESLATVGVELFDDGGVHVATAHGTYKAGGGGDRTPWTERTTPGAGDK